MLLRLAQKLIASSDQFVDRAISHLLRTQCYLALSSSDRFVQRSKLFLKCGHDGRTKTRIRPKITAIYPKPLAVGFQCTNVRSRRGPNP